MRGLKDKVIIVAGVTSGIGEECCMRLGEEGARVVVAGRTVAAFERVAENVRKAGGIAEGIAYDQAEAATITQLMRKTVEKFGRIDGLLCNAAETRKEIAGRDLGVASMEPEVWERMYKINVVGYALLVREALPYMLRNENGGSIVCVTSDASRWTQPIRTCYGGTKAADEALVRYVATQHGRQGIRCNSLAPGLILTERVEINLTEEYKKAVLDKVYSPRLGKPSDIASAAAFLLSDEAEWVQGQVLSVSGGLYFRG